MKFARFLTLLILPLLLMTGCATVSDRDREVLRAHGVSQAVYAKMQGSEPLQLADVIELSHKDVPSSLIIHYMDATDSEYRLKKGDVAHLRREGVSEEVISYMLSTAPPPYSPVVYRRYPYVYLGPYPYGYEYGYGPYAPAYYDGFYGPYGGEAVVVVGGRGGGWHHWGRDGRHR